VLVGDDCCWISCFRWSFPLSSFFSSLPNVSNQAMFFPIFSYLLYIIFVHVSYCSTSEITSVALLYAFISVSIFLQFTLLISLILASTAFFEILIYFIDVHVLVICQCWG